MTLEACAALVHRGDPERFRAAMAAPPEARSVLFPLYAFNVEVARAPWVTAEPMIAEMRLQFWRDTLEEIAEGRPPRAHEVAEDLGFLDPPAAKLLDGLVAARRWDISSDPFADAGAFEAYLDATAGHLAWVAARALGAPGAAEAIVRDAAWAAGLAAFFLAIPELEARGRVPLVDGRPAAVAELAADGLGRLARARARRRMVPAQAVPALHSVWSAAPILRRTKADPRRVAQGGLALAPARLRLGLIAVALTGRW